MAQVPPGRAPEGLLTGSAGADPFEARLDRWVADARIEAAALSRQRIRGLVEAAALDTTFVGVLIDLTEQGTPMVLETAGGRVNGWSSLIGADFVVVNPPSGSTVMVAIGAIEVVRPVSGTTSHGSRTTADLALASVLHELAEDRERVRVTTRTGQSVAGLLSSAGQDLIRLRTDANAAAYVPFAAVATVALTS